MSMLLVNFMDNILDKMQSRFVQIVLIIALCVLIICLIKFPHCRIYVGVIFFVLLSATGVFSGINLNTYYSAQGGIIGSIQQFVNPTQVEVLDEVTFNFSGIEMRAINETTYRANVSTTSVVNIPAGSSYVLLVNNMPCNVKEDDTSSDYLIANYTYTFYSENREELLTDTLTIRIAFNELNTTIYIDTNGGSIASEYWNAYFNKNGFKIVLTTDRYITDNDITIGQGDISSYLFTKFTFNYSLTNTNNNIFDVRYYYPYISSPTTNLIRFGYVLTSASSVNNYGFVQSYEKDVTYSVYFSFDYLDDYTIDADGEYTIELYKSSLNYNGAEYKNVYLLTWTNCNYINITATGSYYGSTTSVSTKPGVL